MPNNYTEHLNLWINKSFNKFFFFFFEFNMFNEENCYQDNCFQLPIEFLNNKHKLSDNLINDLELTETIHEDTKPVYDTVFNPSTEIGKKSIKSWSKYYTTNKNFLKTLKSFIKMLILYHLIK